MKKILYCTLLTGILAPLVHGQQRQDELVANEELDSFAIAEQLYLQTRSDKVDPAGRVAMLNRAAELFGRFTAKFPKSSQYGRAAYMQATCLVEAGNEASAFSILGKLANGAYGEYTAAAAYRLATQASGRNLWEKAAGFYSIVIRTTGRAELRNDSLYRMARTQVQLGKRKDAEATFRRLLVLPDVAADIYRATLMALANMKTEDGEDAEAYSLFLRLLDAPHLEPALRGTATLQAARLASRLGKTNEAQQHYARLANIPGMEKYAGEAQMESILALYKKQDYQGVLDLVASHYSQMQDAAKEARRALIVGQSYMELKQYDNAAQWFDVAENAQPGTPLAADASYRRLICAQQTRSGNFFTLAERHINTYASLGSQTASAPCNDLVRLMYADRMMLVDVAEAARQFDAINFSNLPEGVRADAEYKKAWCASQGDSFDPVPTLDHFIATYTDDAHMPDAIALRGSALLKLNKVGQALKDFEQVIKDYPNSEAVPVCWQKAAQACAGNNPKKMVAYYEGLIKCGSKVKPTAIAEAHYNIARVLYETDPAGAIPHFREARTMNPDHYASLVDLSLVQCYFKMKDAENLRLSLESLEKGNPSSYNALPPAILRWCGWTCFQTKNYAQADKYLSDAVAREPRETYTAADGSQKERPRTEALVWKTLARSRLELRSYERGLEAAEYYLSMEEQPYRRAEGMRDKACLLIGLKRSEEARKLCEEAIALGIDGPIKSSLFIALGDAWYSEGQYSEAAKYYGRTANIISDKELKPIAIYKIICALKRSDKVGEAAQYEEMLRNEFPGWTPPSNVKAMMEGGTRP